jgi:tRNA 2-thiocytidine biosynthesis protein TtcA
MAEVTRPPGTRSSSHCSRALAAFAKKAGRGIHHFDMIREGDRILIGVSGGKDSLALCAALAERRRWVPVDYSLWAAFIDWREYPAAPEALEALRAYLEGLGIPLRVIQAHIHPPGYRGAFSCYICSRNRKRILFDEARRLGAAKVALGHHLDDVVQTTMMNLFFRGEFSTMMPVQSFFGGKLSIIRPLCEVEERDVERLARRYPLPAIAGSCPRKDLNQRILMKEILRRLSRVNRQVKTNIYRSAWNINADYLPAAGAAPGQGAGVPERRGAAGPTGPRTGLSARIRG